MATAEISSKQSDSLERSVRLAIVYRSLTELKPNPGNPRQHSAKQIRQIAASIETFGFICPIVIDADRNVIIGHGRLLAAQRLGLVQVPTIGLEHLSKGELTALRSPTIGSMKTPAGMTGC